jgi:hypothetical protein
MTELNSMISAMIEIASARMGLPSRSRFDSGRGTKIEVRDGFSVQYPVDEVVQAIGADAIFAYRYA